MSTTIFPDVPSCSETSFLYEQPRAFSARLPDVKGTILSCQPFIEASLSGDTMEYRFCVNASAPSDADLGLVDEYKDKLSTYGISADTRQAWEARLSGPFNLGELTTVSKLWADHVQRSMIAAGKSEGEGEQSWLVTLLWEDVPFMPSGNSNPAAALLSPVHASIEDRIIIEPPETTLRRQDGEELDVRTNILIYPDPANPTQPTFQAFVRYMLDQDGEDDHGEGGRWMSKEAELSQATKHARSQGLFHGNP
jgi:hypothetical protein